MKIAGITGVTSQVGSFPAEFLLEKWFEVHGIKRRYSFNLGRIDHIYEDRLIHHKRVRFPYGDLSDPSNLTCLNKELQSDEIYNLAAQSHLAVSFEVPEYTT
jgi:GDPmannose 4,6-dehydratase